MTQTTPRCSSPSRRTWLSTAALEATVEHPDALIVCQVAVSGAVAQAVEATLVKELNGRFLSIARGGGAIEVVLAPNEEVLAGDLVSRYGIHWT